MADYWTSFSFAITLNTTDERDWCTRAIAVLDGDDPGTCVLTDENIATEDDCTTHEHEPPMPELAVVFTEPDWPHVSFAAEVEDDDGLWIHSDESGDVDEAARFVQVFLQKFRPDESVGFEYANTCSKPRLDAFGGGAALITAESIEFMHSGGWLSKRMTTPTEAGFRLTVFGGDHQDFTELDSCITEARKLLDPSKPQASSVTIEVL